MADKNDPTYPEMDEVAKENESNFAMALNSSYGKSVGKVYDRADYYSTPMQVISKETKTATTTHEKTTICFLALILLILSVIILGSAGACTYFVLEVSKLKSEISCSNPSSVQELKHPIHMLQQQVSQLISRIEQSDSSAGLIQNLSLSIERFDHQVSQTFNSSTVHLYQQISQLIGSFEQRDFTTGLIRNLSTSIETFYNQVSRSYDSLLVNSSSAQLHQQISQLINRTERSDSTAGLMQNLSASIESLNYQVSQNYSLINSSIASLFQQVSQLISSTITQTNSLVQNLSVSVENHYRHNFSVAGIGTITSLIHNLSSSLDNINHQVDNSSTCRAAGCSSCGHGGGLPVFEVNLTSGQHSFAPESGMSWIQSLTDPNPQTDCDMQGVLRIVFPQACNNMQTRRLQFDLYFSINRSELIFDIADSTNNGFGGDAGHTSNSAEVHNINETILVYTNNLPGYTSYSTDGHLLVEQIPNALSNHVTITIGDEYVMFDNNRGIQRTYQSKYLFALRGQPTTYGPVDYTIYFSMNRVIYPFSFTSRRGTGLCRAVIRALDCQ